MNRYIFPILCIVYILSIFFASLVLAQAKITIAVLNFEPKNISIETAEAVSDILSTELFNTNRFQVVERKAVAKIFEEHKLQMSGVTDMDQAAQIGQLLNVQKIMIGSVSKLGSTYIINTRLVNVETGELDLAEKVMSSGGETGLPKAIAELATKISAKVTLEGAILQADPTQVMINLGKVHGITAKQLLQVIRVGETITDLDGNIIGKNEDKVGLIQVTEVKDKYSTASIVESKHPFRRGDKVRIASTTQIPVKKEEPKKVPEKKKKDTKKSVAPPPIF